MERTLIFKDNDGGVLEFFTFSDVSIMEEILQKAKDLLYNNTRLIVIYEFDDIQITRWYVSSINEEVLYKHIMEFVENKYFTYVCQIFKKVCESKGYDLNTILNRFSIKCYLRLLNDDISIEYNDYETFILNNNMSVEDVREEYKDTCECIVGYLQEDYGYTITEIKSGLIIDKLIFGTQEVDSIKGNNATKYKDVASVLYSLLMLHNNNNNNNNPLVDYRYFYNIFALDIDIAINKHKEKGSTEIVDMLTSFFIDECWRQFYDDENINLEELV